MIFRIKRYNNKSDNIAWLATLLFFSSFYIFNLSLWGKYILFLSTAIVGFIYVSQNDWKVKLKIGAYHYFIISFILLCYLSAIWAINPSYSTEKAGTIFQILICMSVLYLYYSQKESIVPLIDIVMWGGYIVTFYTIIFTGIDTMRYAMAVGERVGSSFTNINSIGMISAFAVVIAFYKFIFVKKSLNLIFTLPCIFMVAMSGSRKALVLLVIGILLLLLFKYSKGNPLIVIFKITIVGTIAVIIMLYLLTLPMFAVIAERMGGLISLFTGIGEVDSSAQTRDNMIRLGVELFRENPLFGVGIGNARIFVSQTMGHNSYLHNNFVEILSSLGIVGFILYYSIWGYALWNIYKYRKLDDPNTIICIVLILLQIMLDYGKVSYYSKEMYLYLLIFFLQINILKRRYKTNEVSKNIKSWN